MRRFPWQDWLLGLLFNVAFSVPNVFGRFLGIESLIGPYRMRCKAGNDALVLVDLDSLGAAKSKEKLIRKFGLTQKVGRMKGIGQPKLGANSIKIEI